MIKTISSLIVILIILAGCSGFQAENKRYQVEQAYFAADKLTQNYSVKPELRTERDYAALADAYLEVYYTFQKNFPDLNPQDSLELAALEASNLAGKALLSASALLMSSNHADSAKRILEFVINSPVMLNQHRFDALYAAGRVAEQEGHWSEAERYYMELLKKYYPPMVQGGNPNSDVIELPKKITQHYVDMGDTEQASQKVRWAIGYYEGILDSYPKIPMTMMATRLLAEMYTGIGEFQRSADLLATVVDSTGRIFDQAHALIADLYLTRLNRGNEAVGIYNDIIQSGQDSLSIATSYIKLATLAFNEKRFQEGRDFLEDLRKRFPRLSNVQAEAQLLKSRSFEREKNHERARQEYIALLNQFPETPQALEVLIWLPEYFDSIGQNSMAEEWRERSESELRKIASENTNRMIGLQASNLLGTYLLRRNRPTEAIAQFETLRQQYPSAPQAAEALFRIGFIYRYELKDNAKALATFQEFLKQYPGSSVRPSVEAEMKKINQT